MYDDFTQGMARHPWWRAAKRFAVFSIPDHVWWIYNREELDSTHHFAEGTIQL
jgi:hypothetical protein